MSVHHCGEGSDRLRSVTKPVHQQVLWTQRNIRRARYHSRRAVARLLLMRKRFSPSGLHAHIQAVDSRVGMSATGYVRCEAWLADDRRISSRISGPERGSRRRGVRHTGDVIAPTRP